LIGELGIGIYKTSSKRCKKISSDGLKDKAQNLLEILKENPFQNPPPYETLVGDLRGVYSRRITIQHRLVYQVYDNEKIVKVIRLLTHYE
jgi:toxin YoeB